MEQIIATVISCVVSAVSATLIALINSNARQAKTEQKFEDWFDAIKKENTETKERLLELQETDSCCVTLQGDVAEIKENISLMSATLNQFKAHSDEFDAKLKKGFVALAGDSIEQAHRYYMQRGYITESSKKSVHAIYDCYKDFEGNGYEDVNMRDIDSLPEKH